MHNSIRSLFLCPFSVIVNVIVMLVLVVMEIHGILQKQFVYLLITIIDLTCVVCLSNLSSYSHIHTHTHSHTDSCYRLSLHLEMTRALLVLW